MGLGFEYTGGGRDFDVRGIGWFVDKWEAALY